ncbi:MAG: CpsD/CapB family tyrosine-protein kinase [Myxococcales bacterium]|nr:CpsD/CapB family tyrosine-protein kinase [Myxococcales bacterium]
MREALRTLRFNLMRRAGEGARVFLITSAAPNEGKSTVTALLAKSIAGLGRATLVVDADLRRPSQAERFGVPGDRGLHDLLRTGAGARADEYLHKSASGVIVLPAGRATQDASELLSEPHLQDLVREWRETYATVLIDAPPVLAASDTSLLSTLVDGVVVVMASGETVSGEVQRAKTQLEDAGAKLIGIVLNKCPETMGGNPYTPYSATYGERG